MSTRAAPITLALAVLLAAGCGGDTADRGEEADTDAQRATEADASATETPDSADAPARPDRLDRPAGEAAGRASLIDAAATLEARASGVSIRVTLEGLDPEARYPVHVHEGACGAGGLIALPLGRVTGRADSTGSVRMTVGEGRLPPMPFSVRVQSPGGEPVACTDVVSG